MTSTSSSAKCENSEESSREVSICEINEAAGTPEETIKYQINAVERELDTKTLLQCFVQRWCNHNRDFVLRIRVSDCYYKDRDHLKAPAVDESQVDELRPKLADDHLNISLVKSNNNTEFRFVVHSPLDLQYIVRLTPQQHASKVRELKTEAERRYGGDPAKLARQLELIEALPHEDAYPAEKPFLLTYSNAKAVVLGLIEDYDRRISRRYRGLGLPRAGPFDAACLSYPLAN